MRQDVVALIMGAITLLLIIPLTFAMIVTMYLDTPILAIQAFAIPIALAAAFGWSLLNFFTRPDTDDRLRDREAFAAVALSWHVVVFIGALPYWLSGVFHGPLTDGSEFTDVLRGGVNAS